GPYDNPPPVEYASRPPEGVRAGLGAARRSARRMSVRLKIAITIFVTGALTALGVIATVLFAFQRFEHETTYHRANAFLGRVVAMYGDIFELHERHPDEFTGFLRNLVLFEPDTQLYLLDARGTVLSFTGEARLPPGFKVALAPV